MGEEEVAGGGVIELTPIVTLDASDGAAELGGYVGEEVREGGEDVKLQAQWESTQVIV